MKVRAKCQILVIWWLQLLLIQTLIKLRIKLTGHVKYVTTVNFIKLADRHFTERFKKTNWVSRIDFYNTLISLINKLTQIKQNN